MTWFILKKNLRKKKKKKTHHTLRPLSQIFWTLTTPTSSSTPRFIFILTFYPCFSPFNPTPSFHSSPFLPPAPVSREDEAAPIHWELNGLSGDSYQSQPFHTGAQFFVFLLSVLLSNHLTALQQKKNNAVWSFLKCFSFLHSHTIHISVMVSAEITS